MSIPFRVGMEGASLSPAVTRMVGTAAALVSFAESSELLAALAGLAVEAKQVERTAEALGREVAADERQRVVPAGVAEIAPTLYLGMDGTGVPMRKAEVQDRPGKQHGVAAQGVVRLALGVPTGRLGPALLRPLEGVAGGPRSSRSASGRSSSPTPTRATLPGPSSRPTRRRSGATPMGTAPTAGRHRRGRARPCCKGSSCVGGAGAA